MLAIIHNAILNGTINRHFKIWSCSKEMLIDLFFREKPKAGKIFEYQWPQGKGGEYHVLQEQISEFLGVLSFKRKYPGQFHIFCQKFFLA